MLSIYRFYLFTGHIFLTNQQPARIVRHLLFSLFGYAIPSCYNLFVMIIYQKRHIENV